MIHCLIAIFKNTRGYHKNSSYWYDEPLPFVEAAEIGTEKVIKDHSTIGIVVTTDGSIGEFDREEYVDCEKRVINELKEIGKPFIVILNSVHPMLPETEKLSEKLREEYNVPVTPLNIENMNEKDIYGILREALYEFPVLEVNVNMPEWIACLDSNNWLKKIYIEKIRESVVEVDKLRDIETINNHFVDCEYIESSYISEVNTGTGVVTITLKAPKELYNKVLKDIIGVDIRSKTDLLKLMQEYNEAKIEYDQVKTALKMVKATGYGIATPSLKDMKLDTPEVIKQGSRYGIRLKAVAPSIHMIRVDVDSTFEPIIGTEVQSKELIDHLVKDTDSNNVWKSEIFGRSLDVIVQEGIQTKLSIMPESIRYKLQQTLTKVVNKGSSTMITIVL